MIGQTEFTRAVLDPGAPAPDGLTNPDGAQTSKRFDVFRNNVAVSLTEALETAFPVIRKLVGEEMPGFLEYFAPAQADRQARPR